MPHKHISAKPNVTTSKKQVKADPIRKPVKIAIFDDCDAVIIAYGDYLSPGNVTVVPGVPVESVEAAMAIFRKEKPDIVITDLDLSDGTEGFQILELIRKESPSTPVALSTSCYHPMKDDEINREIRRRGYDAVFQKYDIKGIAAFVNARA